MLKYLFFFLFFINESNSFAQASLIKEKKINQGQDLRFYFNTGNQFFKYSKKKERLITYSQIAGYAANFASLYYFWYKDYPYRSISFF